MANTLKQAIEKVVAFWSNKAFKTPMNQDNGADNATMMFLMNQVSMNAQKDITDEQILNFETKLIKLLTAQNRVSNMALHVDYHPDRMLLEAAEHAGIDSKCFPCKTSTWITDDYTAKASYQYRGELQIL